MTGHKPDPANIIHLAMLVNWSKAMIKLYKSDIPLLNTEIGSWEALNEKKNIKNMT